MFISNDWEDEVYLNFDIMTLYRDSKKDEIAEFKVKNNIIIVNWLNWGEEFYAQFNEGFYNLKQYHFKTNDWDDICYIDYINNIAYRPNENQKGNMKLLKNNQYYIKWEILKNNFVSNVLNIENLLNSKIPLKIKEKENYLIPNIIHFVYGFKKQTSEFELYKYIAIKSAICVNQPDKVYFHYKYEPYGKYWNEIKKYLTLEVVNPPAEIYGNNLLHYAHQADVIRLQKLQKYGGIYLDIDTICLKSFEDLRKYKFVIGAQGNKNNSEIYGLCNAVILSEPNNEFVIEWIDSYTSFRSKGRDEFWDEHSVLMPLKLAYKHMNKIKILDNNKFYNPLWYNINEILFSTDINLNEYKKFIDNNYCIHLWDTYSNDYLKKLNEIRILNDNTLYNIFSRKFLKNKISIVFLTFNRLNTTIECLESYLPVLNKDFILELLIFDNNSDKETISFLNAFKNKNQKIKIFFNKENIGVCPGRIELFNQCKGDIICSLDSDAKLLDSSFFDYIYKIMFNEKYGIVGISGAYIDSWDFGDQRDINNDDENEYYCHHISGCCQIFRKDLFHLGFGLDKKYGFFWCEDTDLSLQSLYLNKINYRISGKKYISHSWGGSGKKYHDLFVQNWEYLKKKWKDKILKIR